MNEVQLTDKSQSLSDLLAELKPGEEVTVVDQGVRIAVIRKEPEHDFACAAGSAEGKIHYMADDFDDPLDDFANYI
ncbi:DUF2281 domain-containing protein [Rubripirellula amarantea]|nr:DUF2281 domain-containing protein [Rubripirellula amarantea]